MSVVDGLNHLMLQVSDLDRSEAFYRDIFGMDVVGRNLVAEDGENSLLRTDNGHFVLLVAIPDKVQPFRPKSFSIHHALFLTPEQYVAAARRWEAVGGTTTDSRASYRARGQNSFDVFDPDGHRFQVQSVGPEAYEILKPDAGKIVCGKADDFDIGSVTHFPAGQFFLVRQPEGFLALSHWCTHMNGELRWRENYWSFHCHYHQATFNRKGESTSHIKHLPPLRLHPVMIDAAQNVFVDTDQIVARKEFSLDQLAPVVCAAKETV